jgi:hypothetical protein
MTADIVSLAGYRAAAVPASAADLGAGNAAAAAARLSAACHTLAASLARIGQGYAVARDRFSRLHDAAEAAAEDATAIITAAHGLPGLGRSLGEAVHA